MSLPFDLILFDYIGGLGEVKSIQRKKVFDVLRTYEYIVLVCIQTIYSVSSFNSYGQWFLRLGLGVRYSRVWFRIGAKHLVCVGNLLPRNCWRSMYHITRNHPHVHLTCIMFVLDTCKTFYEEKCIQPFKAPITLSLSILVCIHVDKDTCRTCYVEKIIPFIKALSPYQCHFRLFSSTLYNNSTAITLIISISLHLEQLAFQSSYPSSD